MIVNNYYLSDPKNLDIICDITGLAPDEIEGMVGRFTKQSQWAGELRGELVEYSDGRLVLRHHFKKSVKYWEDQNEEFNLCCEM